MLTTKDGSIWLPEYGYLHLSRIMGFDRDIVKTAFGPIQLPSSVCELVKVAHREWEFREALERIVAASESTEDAVNFIPEMRMKVISEETKALIAFLGE